jgi:uncharacterized protein (DUF111 family)
MQRKVKLIKTSYGKLHVKQLTYGEVTKLSLEHQELAKLATLNQRPLVDLRTEILAELRQIKQKKGI